MHRKKLLLALISLLLAVVALASGTFAWLSKTQRADGAFAALSDFEVTGTVSFGGNWKQGSSILVAVSFDPAADNYIGKMKYVVRYTGISPAYLRVRVLEQWTDKATDEILPATFLPYALGKGLPVSVTPAPAIPAAPAGGAADPDKLYWVDNRAADYCYYYALPVQPGALPEQKDESGGAVVGDGAVELTLFDQKGANPAPDVDGSATEMGLLLEVEAVQPNRYREFWGLSKLPF